MSCIYPIPEGYCQPPQGLCLKDLPDTMQAYMYIYEPQKLDQQEKQRILYSCTTEVINLSLIISKRQEEQRIKREFEKEILNNPAWLKKIRVIFFNHPIKCHLVSICAVIATIAVSPFSSLLVAITIYLSYKYLKFKSKQFRAPLLPNVLF